ncbi:MAG: hypothetical protein KC550_05410 [Nanoarchaeota archaeon]|nr:hypothetical protein [Nanoarchaeota archaeon]
MKYGETEFLKAFQIVAISQIIGSAMSLIPTYIIFNLTTSLIYGFGSFIINLAIIISLIKLIYQYS